MARTVTITVDHGLLRIRYRWQGKRHGVSTGLRDTKPNRIQVERIAQELEWDITSGHFDGNVDKYIPGRQPKGDEAVVANYTDRYVTVPEVFRRYYTYRKNFIGNESHIDYEQCLRYLEDVYNGRDATTVTRSDASELLSYLSEREDLSPRTKRDRLVRINGAWAWAMQEGIVRTNPFSRLPDAFRNLPRPTVEVFTIDEMKRILHALSDHPQHAHYWAFVFFLFHTGTRTSEAIGLRWGNVTNEFNTIRICEQYVRGKVRPYTKTGAVREFEVSEQVRSVLLLQYALRHHQDIVFPSMRRNYIHLSTFRVQRWAPLLSELDIPYKRLYATRKTFISHCLQNGMRPADIAAITGHDVTTMMRHYVGRVDRTNRLINPYDYDS